MRTRFTRITRVRLSVKKYDCYRASREGPCDMGSVTKVRQCCHARARNGVHGESGRMKSSHPPCWCVRAGVQGALQKR